MAGKGDRNAAAGPLATGELAHDLNNIFGAITGYAEFILEDAPAGSLQVDHARKILEAAARGIALAKGLDPGAPGDR